MASHARKNITGKDPGFPPYLISKMEAAGLRPTLASLAFACGVPATTLTQNLHGQKAMRLATAKRIADAIDCSIDDLVYHMPELLI